MSVQTWCITFMIRITSRTPKVIHHLTLRVSLCLTVTSWVWCVVSAPSHTVWTVTVLGSPCKKTFVCFVIQYGTLTVIMVPASIRDTPDCPDWLPLLLVVAVLSLYLSTSHDSLQIGTALSRSPTLVLHQIYLWIHCKHGCVTSVNRIRKQEIMI